MCFFNMGGTSLSLMFVYVLCKFVLGLILCVFVVVVVTENLWFDDMCAE